MWRLHIKNDFSFYDLVKPGLEDFNKLHWFIDVQCGTIDWNWLFDSFDSQENEDLFDGYYLSHQATDNTSSNIFKPGFLPIFGKYILKDECAYYFGFDGRDDSTLDVIVRELGAAGLGPGEWPDAFKNMLRQQKSIFLFADYDYSWEVTSNYEPYKKYFLDFPAAEHPNNR